MLRKLCDKPQNILVAKTASNFSVPYSRIWHSSMCKIMKISLTMTTFFSGRVVKKLVTSDSL